MPITLVIPMPVFRDRLVRQPKNTCEPQKAPYSTIMLKALMPWILSDINCAGCFSGPYSPSTKTQVFRTKNKHPEINEIVSNSFKSCFALLGTFKVIIVILCSRPVIFWRHIFLRVNPVRSKSRCNSLKFARALPAEKHAVNTPIWLAHRPVRNRGQIRSRCKHRPAVIHLLD